MKYYELTQEEEKLLKSFEKGDLKSVSDLKEGKRKYQAIAGETLSKTKNINLRVSEKVVQKLKNKAAGLGVPYQTLASSILHRYASE
jgi:predicted DNA binding CopG/RHH family protein